MAGAGQLGPDIKKNHYNIVNLYLHCKNCNYKTERQTDRLQSSFHFLPGTTMTSELFGYW